MAHDFFGYTNQSYFFSHFIHLTSAAQELGRKGNPWLARKLYAGTPIAHLQT